MHDARIKFLPKNSSISWTNSPVCRPMPAGAGLPRVVEDELVVTVRWDRLQLMGS